MKHQTILNVKFSNLQRRLKLPRCYTVGVLECLWIFTQTNARSGELGRFSADEIAAWLEWPGEPGELIEALVETGWLDRDGDQLAVHDWATHMPTWLKGVNARQPVEPSCTPSCKPSVQLPNPTQPNPTHNRSIERAGDSTMISGDEYDRTISRTTAHDFESGEKIKISGDEYESVRSDCQKVADLLNGRPGVALRPADLDMVKRAVCMVAYRFESKHWLKDLALAVRQKHDLKSPPAYWKTCLRKKVEKLGCDLNTELAAIVIK